MENSDDFTLGDAIAAAAAKLPFEGAMQLEEQLDDAAFTFSIAITGSGADETERANMHMEAARRKVGEAITELELAKSAMNDYSQRIGFGSLPDSGQLGTGNTTPTPTSTPAVEHTTVDPGLAQQPENSSTANAQPPEKPGPPELSAEERASFAIDTEYQESTIEEVHDNGDGTYHVITDRSIGERVPAPDGIPPKVGEVLRQYVTPNLVVRGLVVGGRLQHYHTAQEEEVRSAMASLEIDESQKQTVSAVYDQLPPIIQQRLDFDLIGSGLEAGEVDMQRYMETMSAQQAYEIAKRYKTPAAIEAFLSQPFEQQHEQEPDIAIMSPNNVPSPELTRHIFEYAKWYLEESSKGE